MLIELKFAQLFKPIQRTIKNGWRMCFEQGPHYTACTLDFDRGVLKHRADIRDVAVWNVR
ncbi:MAG TPA: hypothetical protein DD666_13835 [Advenella kashmirensis]|uniref:Uncharacterized protein n=1 Tax=Advenella kashmirensis TaxID=310575 RepID=A0A356LHU3_9BURK|nr:hypothetical protein [Advenella kashmirensis]